jgi:pyruvate/2-oxoacid:ferredoxin oxidoreductase beta subunit
MRRNIGLTAIVVNNSVYGLTGGQSSPTTPVGGRTATARSGSMERPMNLETLARAAGAAFFARGTVNHTASLVKLIERALSISGCALVEIVSNCHVLYGRMNELGDAAEMMKAMETGTRRTTPVLLRRAARPVRLTSPEAPAWAAAAEWPAGVHDDARVQRGVIFERQGSQDYGARYYAMLAERRAQPASEEAERA